VLTERSPPASSVAVDGKRSEEDVMVVVEVPPMYIVSNTDSLVVDAAPDSEAREETESVPVIVVFPEASVPVVDMFSSPNDMEPVESVILPVDIVSVSAITDVEN
jgi:hypothetical protein